MIDHNHFICHFIFGGHLLNIPTDNTEQDYKYQPFVHIDRELCEE